MKRKRGLPSYRESAKLPRYAGFDDRLQYELDNTKENKTHEIRRYGFRLLWRAVPDEMEKHDIPAVDSFHPDNGHKGVCWGWKRECSMSDNKAKQLLLAAFKSKKLTFPMLEAVRKALAYSWQLRGGDPDGNWPGTKKVWKVIKAGQRNLPQTTPQSSTLPRRIPTTDQLKAALLCEWTPDNPWNFVCHCVGRVTFWDNMVWGLRPREDVKRVKKSRTHRQNNAEGWQATKFQGGRAKLFGEKKGNRPWWLWRPCCCPNSKHVPPTWKDKFVIGPDGNPKPGKAVAFHQRCPMACYQFYNLWMLPDECRSYPKWLDSGRFGTSNINDVVDYAIKWGLANGVGDPDEPFDSNSGRKCLSRWLSELSVIYEEGMELHGDHPDTWTSRYQKDCIQVNPRFNRRDQSTDPEVALRALRKLVTWLGIAGEPYKPQLTNVEKMSRAMMEQMGMGARAKRICLGIE